MTDVNLNKDQLKWIRELRNYTLPQAAGQIGITQRELQKFENGLKKPTVTIFRKIAKFYGIPEATLFLNNPPRTQQEQLKDYRTRTIGGIIHEIGPETNLAISHVRAYQSRLSDLQEDGYDYATKALPSIDSEADAFDAGEKERTRINVPLDNQLSWPSADEAFRNWRRIIEAQGINVFFEKFPIDDCRGVSILDNPGFPAILLNKTEPAKDVAWIFSLIHEYAHILIGMPGISDRNFENVTELFCNQFAASFLMPVAFLQKVIRPWPTKVIKWKDEQIIDYARRFKVSQQAMALRLETLNLAPKGFFDSFKEGQPKSRKKALNGHPTPARMRVHILGKRFPAIIISAFDKGAISNVETTQILNANTNLLANIRKELGV